jgi:hypothetical protein
MSKEIAIYLNFLYSRVDTGNFFSRISETLLTYSAGDVISILHIYGNNQME